MAWILTLPHSKYRNKWKLIACLVFNCSAISFLHRDLWWVLFIDWWCRHRSSWSWWRSMLILIYIVLCCALGDSIDFGWAVFYVITNVYVRAVDWNDLKLVYQLRSWIVAYRTSRMPGGSLITSNDICLVLWFVSSSSIWWDFEIKRSIFLKLCIHKIGKPLTCRFRHLGYWTNGRSSHCVSWGCTDFPWHISITADCRHINCFLLFLFGRCSFLRLLQAHNLWWCLRPWTWTP